MESRNPLERIILLGISLLPGMGHLALGERGRAVPLLAFSLLLVSILFGRWDAFMNAFETPAIEHRVAAGFLIIALTLCMSYSIRDVHRLMMLPSEDRQIKSPFQLARVRFAANGLAVTGLYVLGLFYLLALLAPLLAPYDPAAITDILETRYLPPSWEHLFGTDEFGRDVFSRALYGARVSLSVGLLAVLIAICVGTTYGAVAAYFGGVIDNIMMRIVDVVMAFPVFFLMLTLAGIFEANIIFLVLILGLTSWTGTARLIRGEMLTLKELEFTEAARSIGLPDWLIIVRHQIPNALSPVLVQAALMVGGMIGAEAALSFLGIGVQPPTPSWGTMVSAGQDSLLVAWWVAFFPGTLLALVVLSFNLLADGLRDALDPRSPTQRFV